MAKKYFDEYLVSLKPDVDLDSWKQASGSVQNILEKTLLKPFSKNLDNARTQLKSFQDLLEERKKAGKDTSELEEKIKLFSAELEKDEQSFNEFSAGISKGSIYLGIFITSVKAAADAAQQMADKAIDISNQFVSQGSIQVDRDVRDTMAKFGVDTRTAQSITTSAEILGYDISEYAKWTTAQREAFSSLMQEYQTGIDSIDPTKLEQFNKTVQDYQFMQAKYQLKFKLALTEMFADSEGLKDVLGTLSDTMENLADIMTTDAVKTGFDLLMGIINGILEFATAPLNWLGGMSTNGSSSTTTNTANINTTVNTVGNFNPNDLAVDIGLSVQNAMSGR